MASRWTKESKQNSMQKLGIKSFDVVFWVNSHRQLDLRRHQINPITINRSKVLKLNATTNDNQCCDQWKVRQISLCHLICFSIFWKFLLKDFLHLCTHSTCTIFLLSINSIVIQQILIFLFFSHFVYKIIANRDCIMPYNFEINKKLNRKKNSMCCFDCGKYPNGLLAGYSKLMS